MLDDVAVAESLLRRSYAFERFGAAAAVLDASGMIVETNEAWRLFATLNEGDLESTGSGVDYLSVCDRALAAGVGAAGTVAEGLRAILRDVDRTRPHGDRRGHRDNRATRATAGARLPFHPRISRQPARRRRGAHLHPARPNPSRDARRSAGSGPSASLSRHCASSARFLTPSTTVSTPGMSSA